MIENKTSFPKRLLILGNGFDLDLGRHTKYSDYAQSKFWPEAIDCSLFRYLTTKSQIERWFDLEGELANYIDKLSCTYSTKFSVIQSLAKEDYSAFMAIVQGMINFLAMEQKREVDKKSIAASVFRLACIDPAFEKIYSFNYTDLNQLTETLGLYDKPQIEYVHGCLSDNSAILGVNDMQDTIHGCYDYMRKSFNPNYSSHPVSYDLKEADEVIFFGHSLGTNDYHYFQSFFKHQCNEELSIKEKKTITIFTYDYSSRLEIMRMLHEMNDGKTSLLFQQNDLNIFCVKEGVTEKLGHWFDFRKHEIERLKELEFLKDIQS